MGKTKDRIGKHEEILCGHCKQLTNHTVRGSYDTSWSEDEIWGNAEHDLMSCDGCNSVTYRCKSWFSEDMDGPSITLLPHRGTEDTRKPKEFDNLPYGSSLEAVYRQTISAFNEKLSTLTGAGVRLIIEGVCKDQGIKKGPVTDQNGNIRKQKNLEGKINGMVELGLISKKQAETLHEIRFLGNDAAHELDLPTKAIQSTAIDIVEHILAQVYEMPVQTQTLKKRKKPKL